MLITDFARQRAVIQAGPLGAEIAHHSLRLQRDAQYRSSHRNALRAASERRRFM